LMGAYAQGRAKITATTARQGAREIFTNPAPAKTTAMGRIMVASLAIVTVTLAATYVVQSVVAKKPNFSPLVTGLLPGSVEASPKDKAPATRDLSPPLAVLP